LIQRDSMALDKNDQIMVQNLGAEAVKSDQRVRSNPFFFTHAGTPIAIAGTYHGASAFLIAAGPSFRDLDQAKLERVWTMSLNNAATTYRSDANCIVDDPSRFNLSMWLDPKIQKFVPMAAFNKPLWDNRLITSTNAVEQQWHESQIKLSDCPNIFGYRRNERFDAARFLYEETINWGCHSRYGGGRSVMLAALRILFLLGFQNVYLLGVDFEMSGEKKYHFKEDRPAGTIRANMQTYAKLQRWFTELQPHFLKEGFLVRNCNSKSKLTAFPFMPFDEAIKRATKSLGDFKHERTFGMYKTMTQKSSEAEYAFPQ
jgi:hypothetical protein